MRKISRIMRIVTASLLCLTFATSSMVSSTFAKYTTTGTGAPSSARVAIWNFDIDSGSDLNSSYTSVDGNTYYVQSTGSNVIAPGTSGNIVWLRVTGKPEVAYSIDVSGQIDIGDGYDHLIDEIGREIPYFPIGLILYRYEYDESGTLVETEYTRHCVVRLTPDAPASMQLAVAGDSDVTLTTQQQTELTNADKTIDQYYRMSLFSSNRSIKVSGDGSMETKINNTSNSKYGLNDFFDKTLNHPAAVYKDTVYALVWDWAYNADSGPQRKNSANAKKTHANGKVYTYQTRELDTQLGEAIQKNPENFGISVELSVTISQINTYS